MKAKYVVIILIVALAIVVYIYLTKNDSTGPVPEVIKPSTQPDPANPVPTPTTCYTVPPKFGRFDGKVAAFIKDKDLYGKNASVAQERAMRGFFKAMDVEVSRAAFDYFSTAVHTYLTNIKGVPEYDQIVLGSLRCQNNTQTLA